MSDMISNAKGFSPTNLRYMMRFYGLFKDIVIVPQVEEQFDFYEELEQGLSEDTVS